MQADARSASVKPTLKRVRPKTPTLRSAAKIPNFPSVSSPLSQLKPATAWLIAALLATLHAWLALTATTNKSGTSDEMAHIVGGYAFDRLHDYRLHPENGILTQRLHALPLLGMDLRFPDLESAAWKKSDVWLVGHAFLFELGNPHEAMLFRARAVNALFGAAIVLLVFGWSARCFGPPAGLFSAALACFCPNLMAHGALATSDAASTFFLLASLGAWWRWLRDGGRGALALSMLCFAGAAVVKYASVLLLPFGAILAAIRIFRSASLSPWGGPKHRESLLSRCFIVAAAAALHAGAAWLALWAVCGFRYSMFNPSLPGAAGTPILPWDVVLSIGGWKAGVLQFCRDWQLVPEAFIYGFAFVLKHAEARGAFFDGAWGIHGWFWFFPYAFLVKTPPSQLIAFVVGGGALLAAARGAHAPMRQRLAQTLDRAAPLLVLFLGYWGVSIASHLNIGHRHILPTYPPLFILAGALLWSVHRSAYAPRTPFLPKARQPIALPGLAHLRPRLVLGIAGVLLASAAWDNLQIRPHYLAYFNTFAGGPENAWRRLVDSSLDWGQDLPGLRDWLVHHRKPNEPLHLSYFGTSEPSAYAIDAIRMPMIHAFGRQRPWYFPEPGLYAISATMLQGVYFPTRGPWTEELEKEYRTLRANDAHFRRLKANPHGETELLAALPPAAWARAWDRYELLRFLRLCHYLRARGPDDHVGYSILIYRLSAAELHLALEADFATLQHAIDGVRGLPSH